MKLENEKFDRMNSQTVVFYLATVALVAVSVAGHEGFTLPGSYVMETKSDDANFGKYLTCIGVDDAKKGDIQKASKVEVCIKNPSGENWEVERKIDGKATKIAFESGKPFEGVRADGAKVKSTITVDRNTHTAHRSIPIAGPSRYATTDVVFNADPRGGFTATLRCGVAGNAVAAELKFAKAVGPR